MVTRTGVKDEAYPGSVLLVVHNFVARGDDELTLAKGDRVELIEKDDDFGDGWYLGRHTGNGKTGLFPEVYTTIAPKPTLANATQQRRGSEGPPKYSRNADTTTPSSPKQYRHSSASAISTRPASTPTSESIAASSIFQPALRPSVQPTSAPRTDPIPTASPVMHETLSVIDEHMNDMNTPPGSFTTSTKRSSTTLAYPYIAGHETDDEENQLHTEDEVMAWSPERVAEYLEDQGVEKSHCDVFKEQEISGEILLAMEQSSLFLKEFALGSVGRRLKTWHKVRALQHEVRRSKSPEVPRSTLEYPDEEEEDATTDSIGRPRASTVGSVLPRALDTSRQSMIVPGSSSTLKPTSQSASTPSTADGVSSLPRALGEPEDPWKLSVQEMREEQIARKQARRNSRSPGGSIDASNRENQRKKPSIDETWQLGQPQANGEAAGHVHSMSADTALSQLPKRESSLNSGVAHSTSDNDGVERGGLLSSETGGGTTSTRQIQIKAPTSSPSADVSRTNSNRRSTLSGGFISQDSIRESFSPTITQGIFGALNSVGSSFRSATSPQIRRKPMVPSQDTLNPIVTKLEYSQSTEALTTSPNPVSAVEALPQRSTTSPRIPFLSSSKAKATGMRTISDAVTKNERLTASPVKGSDTGSPVRTGSTTPSTETQSLEFQKSEAVMRMSVGSGGSLVPPPPSQRRIRAKTKKATSAYTRGLERKTPAEQIFGSDYSGWMKKKSGSLMTTWKTRLFILRGRRLSYYYADSDTEEKGLIDISFHRVLPVLNETLTGLHAAMTGAAGTPSSPKDSTTQTAAQKDLEQSPAVGEINDGIFIFKLVPPKSGLPKGVNFTKPTVHYFAVNSRQEGRLWMAALMKATIDRDEGGQVTTTYNQKTISLAKARARRERPPALRDFDTDDRAELDGADDGSSKGLGIGGLKDTTDTDTVGGAEAEKGPDEASSVSPSTLAPSTAATGLESFVGEPEAVAHS